VRRSKILQYTYTTGIVVRFLLKLLADSVADELLEADIVSHLKQILAANDAVVELLHNSLMLVKSLSVIGQFIASCQLTFLFLHR